MHRTGNTALKRHFCLQTKIGEAVEQRTKHQGAINHFEKKLDEEQAKVKAAQDTADLVEGEFKVGSLLAVHLQPKLCIGLDCEG